MTVLNDFHVILNPNIQSPGTWDIRLDKCPLNMLAGPKGSIQPNFTKQRLIELRNHTLWPDLDKLKSIGHEVWQSLMTPALEAAYIACLDHSRQAHQGMRLIVSMVGEETGPAVPGIIRLQELPVEALYFDAFNFLAPNPDTPISRSLNYAQDREPQSVILPLRILVVVATPSDKPPAKSNDEKKIIKDALSAYTGPGGAVALEFCDPPTRSELTRRLQKGFHILHFIGHGAFDVVGEDPSPRAHLCLEKSNRESDIVDAKTLDILMQNSGVRLVVMTSCASATPTPDEVKQIVGPFDGVAQTLVSGTSGVNAVVAMQFDLESTAAVLFTYSFYTHLLSSNRKLDEVVAACRRELIGTMDAGHRAWINPVVYWHCIDSKVFEIAPLFKKYDEQTTLELNKIDAALDVFLNHIAWAKTLTPEFRQAALPEIAKWLQTVEDLQYQRGLLLGETLRLRGGSVKPDEEIKCKLTIRLRTPAQIGDLSFHMHYPAEKVEFIGKSIGKDLPNKLPAIQNPVAGEFSLILNNISENVQWVPKEYELAVLNFKIKTDVTDPYFELKMTEPRVQRDGVDLPYETLNAVLFIT